MSDFDEYTGECCTDCAMLIANGETPPEMSEEETDEYFARIEHNWGDKQMHVSLTCEEDTHVDFSWSACGWCGSPLGGSRCPFVVLVPKEKVS